MNLEAGLHILKYLVVAVLRSPKNAKFLTSVLRCWRLCRLSSAFKIHSKGCKSNGEALWLCYCLIFLSTYWFSDIFSPFKKHILRWNTLYKALQSCFFMSATLGKILIQCAWWAMRVAKHDHYVPSFFIMEGTLII